MIDAASQDADTERVLGARVADRHLAHAELVDEPAQLEVDLSRGQVAGIEARPVAVDLGRAGDALVELDQSAGIEPCRRGYRVHTITSLSYGSYVSISWSITARIAISSEASTTMSSPSYSTSGLAASSSLAIPSASSDTQM